MMAPGVLTTNHGGEGHAHETFMRGFASREGQDIEFLVDGVPLNEVSNPHNHGYADLYFMPPELVQSVAVTEGAFDPEQGDFAFAGTAEYRLGVPERGVQLKQGYGIWNTHRTLALYAPPDEETGTFAGFEYFTTDGYGENRAAQRALALGRFSDDWGAQDFKYAISVYGYATRYDQAGVIRQDDYEAGEAGFFDTYDSNQGGESNRLLLSLHTEAGPAHSRFDQVLFFGFRTMRQRVNFTGWITDSTVDEAGQPLVAQRGDGLEMRYEVFTGGSRGRYTISEPFFGQKQDLTLGYAVRVDHGSSEQLRLRSVTAIPYRQVFDNDITVLNLAGWLRTQLRPWSWLALRGGVRLDTFSFGITNQNQPEADREGLRVSSQTSQSFGLALNPRLTLDLRLLEGLHALASYGQGTRSSDAAALSDNETAPFARAQEFDVGFAYRRGEPGDPADTQRTAQL
jgi:iron complex outermembrane receptor protein